MEVQLRARLLANSPVAAIVANRISWGVRPQGEAYPSLVLTVIDDPRPQTFKANIDVRSTLVQMDCYGITRAQVAALREAAISAIVPPAIQGSVEFLRAFIDTVRGMDMRTETGVIYRDTVDVRIWHRSVTND
jgi:hypothetical protein